MTNADDRRGRRTARLLFDEMAYGINPTTGQPEPVQIRYAPNHWATAVRPLESHASNFPALSPEMARWVDEIEKLGYGIRRRARLPYSPAIDGDRIAQRYAELTAPARPYLPGDPRMYQYGNEVVAGSGFPPPIWATDFGWHRMWSATRPRKPLPPAVVERMTAGIKRFMAGLPAYADDHTDCAEHLTHAANSDGCDTRCGIDLVTGEHTVCIADDPAKVNCPGCLDN